mmetsp:Transcript_10453/g.24282  ORF Transcript_10453/g.24282 Transcript_10453/m.24282 type:complete len:453 (-) Transcript_10453:139-1497(-)
MGRFSSGGSSDGNAGTAPWVLALDPSTPDKPLGRSGLVSTAFASAVYAVTTELGQEPQPLAPTVGVGVPKQGSDVAPRGVGREGPREGELPLPAPVALDGLHLTRGGEVDGPAVLEGSLVVHPRRLLLLVEVAQSLVGGLAAALAARPFALAWDRQGGDVRPPPAGPGAPVHADEPRGLGPVVPLLVGLDLARVRREVDRLAEGGHMGVVDPRGHLLVVEEAEGQGLPVHLGLGRPLPLVRLPGHSDVGRVGLPAVLAPRLGARAAVGLPSRMAVPFPVFHRAVGGVRSVGRQVGRAAELAGHLVVLGRRVLFRLEVPQRQARRRGGGQAIQLAFALEGPACAREQRGVRLLPPGRVAQGHVGPPLPPCPVPRHACVLGRLPPPPRLGLPGHLLHRPGLPRGQREVDGAAERGHKGVVGPGRRLLLARLEAPAELGLAVEGVLHPPPPRLPP